VTGSTGSTARPALSREGSETSAHAARALAVRVTEAAEMLSMSRDSFERHVLPDVRVIRRGRLLLVPVKELERWCEREAAFTLEPR